MPDQHRRRDSLLDYVGCAHPFGLARLKKWVSAKAKAEAVLEKKGAICLKFRRISSSVVPGSQLAILLERLDSLATLLLRAPAS